MLQASQGRVGITRARSGLIIISWLSRIDIREVIQGFNGKVGQNSSAQIRE
jgi:hypothetical protein